MRVVLLNPTSTRSAPAAPDLPFWGNTHHGRHVSSLVHDQSLNLGTACCASLGYKIANVYFSGTICVCHVKTEGDSSQDKSGRGQPPKVYIFDILPDAYTYHLVCIARIGDQTGRLHSTFHNSIVNMLNPNSAMFCSAQETSNRHERKGMILFSDLSLSMDHSKATDYSTEN